MKIPHSTCLSLEDGNNGELIARYGHIERITQTTVVLSLHQFFLHPVERIIIHLIPAAFSETTLACSRYGFLAFICFSKREVTLLVTVVPALVHVHIGILLYEILGIRSLGIVFKSILIKQILA